MPSLPFKDNSVRKSTEEPFFNSWYDEEEEEEDGVVAREEIKQREGRLVGLH